MALIRSKKRFGWVNVTTVAERIPLLKLMLVFRVGKWGIAITRRDPDPTKTLKCGYCKRYYEAQINYGMVFTEDCALCGMNFCKDCAANLIEHRCSV